MFVGETPTPGAESYPDKTSLVHRWLLVQCPPYWSHLSSFCLAMNLTTLVTLVLDVQRNLGFLKLQLMWLLVDSPSTDFLNFRNGLQFKSTRLKRFFEVGDLQLGGFLFTAPTEGGARHLHWWLQATTKAAKAFSGFNDPLGCVAGVTWPFLQAVPRVVPMLFDSNFGQSPVSKKPNRFLPCGITCRSADGCKTPRQVVSPKTKLPLWPRPLESRSAGADSRCRCAFGWWGR